MGDNGAGIEIPHRAESLAGVYQLLILTTLVGGVNFSVTRIAVSHLPPLTVAEGRFIGAAAMLLIILRLSPGHRPAVRLCDLPVLLGIGITGFALATTLINYAMLTATAGESGIIVGTSPVITAVMASIVLRERITLTKLSGLLLAFAGVATITLSQGGFQISIDHLLADLALLGAAISVSLFSVLGKIAMRRFSPLATSTYAITISALVLIPAVTMANGWQPLLTAPADAWLAIAYTIIGATVFMNVAWYKAVKRLGASNAAVFSNAMAVAAVFSGAVILHEPITVFHLIGLVLVIAGILLTTRTSSSAAPTTRPVLAHE